MNYLSTPLEYTPSESSINLPLVQSVLAMQQGSYNIAKQKVQQTLDAFGLQKMLRPQDNEYIQAKLNSITNKINSYGDKNLAHSNVSDSMMGDIKSAANDPFILSAMENTYKYKNYQAEVEKIKEKKPQFYNDANNAYALYKAGYNDYMNGKVNDIGSLSYTPYKDLTEEHLKKLKTIKDIKGKRFIEEVVDENGNPDPNGKYKVRKEIDGLTQNEIQGYMGSLMTSEELTQMKINGWAKFGQQEQEARKYFSDYIEQRLEATESDIKLYETRANNSNLTPKEKAEAKQKADVLRDTKQSILDTKNSQGSLPIDMVSLELEKGNYLNGLGQLASTEWSQTVEANDVYYKDRELEVSYEKMAIDREENERKRIEFEAKMAKNGLSVTGTPLANSVVTVSPAEVDTKDLGKQIGQENLQKRHDTYYKIITDTAKSFLTGDVAEPEDKKAFTEELRSRGLDANLNWIKPNNTASKVATIKEAFDSARLGGMYKKESEIISDALIKKQNIAKDIVNVENQSFKKTFDASQSKYVEQLTDLARIAKQTTERVVSNSLYKKNRTEEQIKTDDALLKYNKFIADNGGVTEATKKLKTDGEFLRAFAKITEEVDNSTRGVLLRGGTLNKDAKVETEKILQEKSKTGTLSSFTDYNTINFINENVNAQIINSIPQDRLQGEVFDPKMPMTARLVGEEIVIEQYRGGSSKDNTFTWGNKNSKAVLGKGDASYEIMMQYIQEKEGEQMGLNADETSVKLSPSKPRIIKSSEKVKSDNMAYNIAQAVQENPNLMQLFPTVGGNPTAYTNETTISNVFEEKLKDYPQEVVENFTNTYLKRIEGFTLTPSVEKLYGDKKWAISIKNDQNEEILKTSLGIKLLDKDTKWLIENAPQTFITEFILRELITDKKKTKINTILDGGN